MFDNIRYDILKNFKDKIGKEEKEEDYYNFFKKEQLERLFKINAVIKNDSKELAKIALLGTKPKKEVVEEFKKEKKKIYANLLKCIDDSILSQLNYYLKAYQDNLLVIAENRLKVSLHFVDFLNENCLAKVNYSVSKKILTFYTPLELRKEIEELLKDKKIKKYSRENTIINGNLHNLISTYGIIPLKNLNIIYNRIYGKIKEEKLFDSILLNNIIDDNIRLVPLEDDYLAYGLGFDEEDDVFTFYYQQEETLNYKEFNIEEYEKIGEGTYHNDFKEYKELCKFLEKRLHLDEIELNEFNENFILDYIYSYELDEEIAKKNLKRNLSKMYKDLKPKDATYISKEILSIARNYPNFLWKGYSYNEIKKNKKGRKNENRK